MEPSAHMTTSLLPSADMATAPPGLLQFAFREVQVTPESIDVKMFPYTSTSFVPSDDDATEYAYTDGARDVHVAPESVDVYVPPSPTATNLVPSDDDATEDHCCEVPRGVHVAPESVDV